MDVENIGFEHLLGFHLGKINMKRLILRWVLSLGVVQAQTILISFPTGLVACLTPRDVLARSPKPFQTICEIFRSGAAIFIKVMKSKTLSQTLLGYSLFWPIFRKAIKYVLTLCSWIVTLKFKELHMPKCFLEWSPKFVFQRELETPWLKASHCSEGHVKGATMQHKLPGGKKVQIYARCKRKPTIFHW